MFNLGENNFNELPMQNKWKLTLSLVSCYHQQSETNVSSCDVIGNYLRCNLPVWCSCRTCIKYSMRQGCAICGSRAKCNATKWISMPVTSTRQPVWNEGAARGLICLIAFGPSVIKVAHPWNTTICETGSLINACDLHPDDHTALGGCCTASSF